ncbi:glutamyl-tRNA reductase [Lewinellaceae bacterium SD302]|nr:glutamyl-tRNA reductase [Lewinellaceae bacterium SD302]
MLQHFHILTLTHRHSDLKDIGRLALAFNATEELRPALNQLMERQRMNECFYLATCNRISFFFTTEAEVNEDYKLGMLPERAEESLLREMVHYQGRDAVSHLCEVAASIDSLVIGERQILGQLREAYEQCRQWGMTGDDLRVIFDRVVIAAKDVYANTRIGEKSVSVVSLSVRKMLQLVPRRDARVLLIGAGQTNTLVTKFLRKYEYPKVTVFNRSPERAENLAKGFAEGQAYPLDELTAFKGGFDVIFVCTASFEPIINADNLPQLLNGESLNGKLIIDLAVPSNVSGEVAAMTAEGLHYVGVEDLRQLAKENMSFRSREILIARDLLDVHLNTLGQDYRQRQLEIAMRQLPAEIKEVRQRAINEVFAKELEGLDPETRELFERVTLYMEKKCIGIPMKTAREALIGQRV